MSNALHEIDEAISHAIFSLARAPGPVGPMFDGLVTYGGLIPYELYVLPGMMLAIIYAMFKDHAASLRFHVLPHVFAFSVVGLVKMMVKRPRPGCYGPNDMVMNFEQNFVKGEFNPSKGKCKHNAGGLAPWASRHGFPYVSFPSGHATVAWSVMTGLILYMSDDRERKWTAADTTTEVLPFMAMATCIFAVLMTAVAAVRGKVRRAGASLLVMFVFSGLFLGLSYTDGIDFNDPGVKSTTIALGATVATLVSLHRIAKGYHHFFDSVVGMLLGMSCGMAVYTMWPTDTSLTPGAQKFVDALQGPGKNAIGAFAVMYLAFFFAYETKCIDEGGCDLLALAKTEH